MPLFAYHLCTNLTVIQITECRDWRAPKATRHSTMRAPPRRDARHRAFTGADFWWQRRYDRLLLASPMPTATHTFRVFVSSTFEDLKEERNALQSEVFPDLKKLCGLHGARFQAIDLVGACATRRCSTRKRWRSASARRVRFRCSNKVKRAPRGVRDLTLQLCC